MKVFSIAKGFHFAWKHTPPELTQKEMDKLRTITKELNKELIRWEYVFNCIRPHHSLGNKTPLQFLKDNGISYDYKPLIESHML